MPARQFAVTGLAANRMYRIDNLFAERVGLGMLQHPFALVENLDDARTIVAFLNQREAASVEAKEDNNAAH